jgi:hypothetical protein
VMVGDDDDAEDDEGDADTSMVVVSAIRDG